MRRGIVVCLVGAASACSLFTSLNGFSNGDATDGGPSTTDAAATDAPTDAVSDGTADGGRYCATVDATFCEDFDDPADPSFSRWKPSIDMSAMLTPAEGYSPPSSLQATTPPITNTDQLGAYLTTSFPNVARVRYHFRFRIDAAGSDISTMMLFQVESLDTAGNRAGLRLRFEKGEFALAGAIYPKNGAGTFPDVGLHHVADVGKWHEMSVSVDWTKSPAEVSATYDATNIAANAPLAGATFGPATFIVYAGIYYSAGPATTWRARVDDITVDTQ